MKSGDAVGGFVIDGPAGIGGMGTVYRAHERTSGGAAALKLVAADSLDIERFLREARVLAELRHPAIVRYLAHGRTDAGGAWLAMEWLEGEDLGERLRRDGLGVDESVRLGQRIAGGLALAHRLSIVHRDIKPANVFLPSGDVDQAKLLDFGVARPLQTMADLTHTGVILGTPAYMAPEQIRSRAGVDARADVFSLGCVLYECLTGRPAFYGDHVLTVLARILFEEAPPLPATPDIPAALAELLARMLAKDPAQRPPDAHAVLAELDQIAEHDRLSSAVAAPAAPRPMARAALSTAERRVWSVVLAGPSTGDGEGRSPPSSSASSSSPAAAPAPPAPDASAAPAEPVQPPAECEAVARRFGAQVERLTGGTIFAVLAARGPATDQAADAARLALALRTLLPDSPIALATGAGVIEAPPGRGSAPYGAPGSRPAAAGDALDRAARLLGQHGPGIWIDPVSAALLEGRFELAGNELLGARDDNQPPALLGRPAPCYGREHELATLDAVYAEVASEPTAHAVLVTAAPGAGKSRLRHEWLRRLADRRDPALVLICRGDPMSAGSPFGLAAQAVRIAAGLAAGEPAETQRRKLRAHVSELIAVPARARITTYLGELLGLPGADTVSVRGVPGVLGDQIRLAWEDWLHAECAARPVILVLEDLHWGDAPSVALVDAALRHLHEQPLFVLAFGRRDVHDLFPRLWHERALKEVRLADLPRRAAEKLVTHALGEGATPAQIARIVERGGGNVLYLEELIRAAVEAGASEAPLPESVVAMVQARLAALPAESRRVLRAASVFGESFWRGGVAALVGELDVGPILDELLRRELLTTPRRPPRFPDEVELSFRHALFREAAYAMLTEADRALGHRLAATWLLAAGERQALVLGEHLERGGAPAEAIPWYTLAASEAIAGNDFAGAVARASRGIICGAQGAALGHLRLLQATAHNWRGEHKEAEWCARQALELLPAHSTGWYDAIREILDSALPAPRPSLTRLVAALVGQPPADDEALPSYVKAVATATNHLFYHGDRAAAHALLDVVNRIGVGLVPGWVERLRAIAADFDGAHDEAHAAYTRAITAFESTGNLRQACSLRCNVGWLEATELGLHARAEETLRAALATARRMGLGRTIPAAEQNLGVALMRLGRLDEARALLDGTVAEFVKQNDTRMEAGSLFYLCTLHALRGDLDAACAAGQRAIDLARDVPTTRACSLAALSRAQLAGGDVPAALASARESQKILDGLGGIEEGEALIRLAFAEALAAAGLTEEARAAARAARARLDARAARITDPEIRRSFLESVPENAATRLLPQEP